MNLQDFANGTDRAQTASADAPTSRSAQAENKLFQDYLKWGVSGTGTGGTVGTGGGTLPAVERVGGTNPLSPPSDSFVGSSSSMTSSGGSFGDSQTSAAPSTAGSLGSYNSSTPGLSGFLVLSGPVGPSPGYAGQVSDSLALIDSAPQQDSIATAGTVGDTTVVKNPDGNVTSETNPLGEATSFAYNSTGERTAVTDALGNVTSIAYDPAGDVVSVTDPDGNKTTYAYDSAGRLIRMTDPLGHSATYAYNAAGLLASTTDRDGRRRDFFYNASGQITAENWYDASGNLVDELRFGYDSAGRLIAASSDEGAYTFAYDAAGRLVRETEPFGLWLAFSYDAAGDRTGVQDSFGGATVSSYDAQGRLISRQLSAPGQVAIGVSLAYRPDGEVDTLTRSAGGSTVGGTDDTYDNSGDLTGIAHLDASGNVLDGFVYAYDAAGRVTSQSDFGGAEDPIGPTNWQSTPAQLDAATLAALQAGHSSTVNPGTASPSASLSTGSAGGGLAAATDGFDSTTNYTYDADGQLITAGAQSYRYDDNGNRINPGYVIGPDNQLLSDGTWDYTYDADGNEIGKVALATGVSWAYGYDDANQMTSATEYAPGGQAILAQVSYTYDVFGNRLQQTTFTASTGVTTVQRYGYDGQNVWADLNSSNQLETRYLDGDAVDQILARVGTGGAVAWYLTDRLGSVRDIMDDSGAILDHRNYDAFGNITYETNSAAGDRYGFTGREFEITTGLQYNRARYYDPSIGRWASQDPMGVNAGDANLYRYSGNLPTDLTDPSGNWGEGVAMGKNRGGAVNPNNITNRDGHGAEVILNMESRMLQFTMGAAMVATGISGAVASAPTGVGPIAGVAVATKGLDNMQAAVRGTDTYVGQATRAVVKELGGSEKQAAVASFGMNLATDVLPGAVLSKTLAVEKGLEDTVRGLTASEAGGAELGVLSNAESVAPNNRGVWELGPGPRGEAIEGRLGQNLPQNFPTIDRFENGVATSIKSLDLSGSSYLDPANITRVGQGYVDKVAGFRGRNWAGTSIRPGDVTGRGLDLAVPPGAATPGQQQALQGLIEYGKQRGVNVRIVEIQ